MRNLGKIVLVLLSMTLSIHAQETSATGLAAATVPGLAYTNAFFPGTTYDPDISTLPNLLGRPAGNKAALAGEIEHCLKQWAGQSDRVKLVEYGRSHENRPLYYMVVSMPANMARLEEIQAGMAKLGIPRTTSESEAETLIESMPAIGWLSYTIHGDETEGSDAALAVLYHLIAATDDKTIQLLKDVVVIVDPLMNPDGRERFLKMVAEQRGASPNVDDNSLLHQGYWPWGRGNHYLFDLNRDTILGVHPETRGRLKAIAAWNPLLYVDAHGMSAQETHLFSPPREPINLNVPQKRREWNAIFARDQARAFDQQGWIYYNGEWNEDWYAGYTDGWAAYRGAVGILYEQARIAEDGVRRPEGRILSYRESVRHHVTGSMANLETLRANAKKLLRDFYADRRASVSSSGPYARRVFALLPTPNQGRLERFVDLMKMQGFELLEARSAFPAGTVVDQLGRSRTNTTIPAGTLLIPNRQPLARLLAAMLEFDPKLPAKSLSEEYEELMRTGHSRIYDITAWNLTMLYGLEALTLTVDLPETVKPYKVKAMLKTPPPKNNRPAAHIIDGGDDRSVSAAARLMERGVEVRVAEKPFKLDGRDFSRGSVVILPLDNRPIQNTLASLVSQVAGELKLTAMPVSTGYGEGDLPDLGGGYFTRLQPPRIGLFGRGQVEATDYGAIWEVLDHQLGVRFSLLESGDNAPELSRYNVLILPEQSVTPGLLKGLNAWVRNGGTLIAIGDATEALTGAKSECSKVRPLTEVLEKLGDYELALSREWLAKHSRMAAPEEIWGNKAATNIVYPWTAGESGVEAKELKKRDEWQRLFMPQGAMVASRVNEKHWLTAGCGEMLPILVGRHPVLMAGAGVEAPIRYGYYQPAEKPVAATNLVAQTNQPASTNKAVKTDVESKQEKKEIPRIGWAALPEGYDLYLRMSGLLWPEAAHRLANAAYVTREPLGRGQIILFATPPAFRASTLGAQRVFLNAVVCGPGFGAAQPVTP